jgi:hypothetical protein
MGKTEAVASLAKLQASEPTWYCTPRGVFFTTALAAVVVGAAMMLESLDLETAWATFR